MENYKHIPIEFRGFEFDLEVYYTRTESQFSDEVQGVTIDFVYPLHNPKRAMPISARLQKAILEKYHNSIVEQLADGDV
tara:strand:+ start:11916 stop:12152 length:237 start_codon:yes stop_codon:yes gene_type:complete